VRLFDQVRPDVMTVRYNLLSPRYPAQETDIVTFARHHQVGVLIKQALSQGLILRDPNRSPRGFSPADHRSRDPDFQPTALAEIDRRLVALRGRFGTSPAALARIAIGYALQHAPDAAVLVGFRDADQITTTLTGLDDPLHPDEVVEITALLHPDTTDERTPDRAVHRD
jgi:aryl-alcohol dehydrogenase-like predicted oxidoreductase